MDEGNCGCTPVLCTFGQFKFRRISATGIVLLPAIVADLLGWTAATAHCLWKNMVIMGGYCRPLLTNSKVHSTVEDMVSQRNPKLKYRRKERAGFRGTSLILAWYGLGSPNRSLWSPSSHRSKLRTYGPRKPSAYPGESNEARRGCRTPSTRETSPPSR